MFTQSCIPVFIEALFIIGAKKNPRQTWKQMSVSRLMGKQIVMYLYSVIVHSDTKELTICNNIDES